MGLEVLTKELLTTAAVEAFSAEFRVVCNNSVSNIEPLDLWADSGNDTNGLMSGNQRELRKLGAALNLFQSGSYGPWPEIHPHGYGDRCRRHHMP